MPRVFTSSASNILFTSLLNLTFRTSTFNSDNSCGYSKCRVSTARTITSPVQQKNMTGQICRIERWASTGEIDYSRYSVGNTATGSTTGMENSWLPSMSCQDETEDSEPEDCLLVGLDDNLLIPNAEGIWQTFLKGHTLWNSYVACANSIPLWSVSSGSFDPYILMQNVPALPPRLPKRNIRGEAVWRVECPELPRGKGEWNPEYVHGAQKSFHLSVPKPIQLRLSSESAFPLKDSESNALAVLTALWSYIFSVRLLELQRRTIRYCTKIRSPIVGHDISPQPGDIFLDLTNASRDLTRLLAAILAPGLGWMVTGPCPPWAAHFSEDTRFVIKTDTPHIFCPEELPPSSQKAADLLIEFCAIFGIGSFTHGHKSPTTAIPQPTAAFLAVLVLPLYNSMGLQPQLPLPRRSMNQSLQITPPDYIRDYVNDLSYYLTLSISPGSIGSIIWSIFWEPGIDCNLVSPWFGSILKVLEPIIKARDIEVLTKVFMARRQSPALLWFGVLLLGDFGFLHKVVSYLETHEEHHGGSWSRPNTNVAVWTNSRQSFLDEACEGSYDSIDSSVLRSDLVRHRFNFRLRDSDTIRYGWQPMGHVPKYETEPELWRRLECSSSRVYNHWVWWLPKKDKDGSQHMMRRVEHGFSYDKAGHSAIFSDHLNYQVPVVPQGMDHTFNIGPSKDATFAVLCFGAKDATGDRSLDAMGQGIRQHPWLADSRGL